MCDNCYDGLADEGNYDPSDEELDAFHVASEGNLRREFVSALSKLTQDERDGISQAIKTRQSICVGSWGVDGEKQSYTCVMGAAVCMMESIPVSAFVNCVKTNENDSNPATVLIDDTSYAFQEILDTYLSPAGRDLVPAAFDNYYEAVRDTHTVLSRGGETSILNERGRNALAAMLVDAA